MTAKPLLTEFPPSPDDDNFFDSEVEHLAKHGKPKAQRQLSFTSHPTPDPDKDLVIGAGWYSLRQKARRSPT